MFPFWKTHIIELFSLGFYVYIPFGCEKLRWQFLPETLEAPWGRGNGLCRKTLPAWPVLTQQVNEELEGQCHCQGENFCFINAYSDILFASVLVKKEKQHILRVLQLPTSVIQNKKHIATQRREGIWNTISPSLEREQFRILARNLSRAMDIERNQTDPCLYGAYILLQGSRQ